MKGEPTGSIKHHFADLRDPRVDRTRLHNLLDIVVIAICAVICRADSWADVEAFGKAKYSWFKTFLALPNGIPSHDTFGRVFAKLDPEQFQACLLGWFRAVSEITQGQVVAIDGKTLRRSHDRVLGKGAIVMVSAWATANNLVLGQAKVDDRSTEVTAIPELLRILDISGCIITIDAMGCHRDIAAAIVRQDADYVLALKENQARLYADVQLLFDDLEDSGYSAYQYEHERTAEKGHGRIETRQCCVISDPAILRHLRGAPEWCNLRAVVRVRAERRVGQERSTSTRYYLSSLDGSAQRLLAATRSHWGIENGLHWVLDIGFREDECRVRKGHGAQNMTTLRRFALNLLKQEKTAKMGIRAKRLRAGWDQDYLLTVLSSLAR